MDIKEIVDHVMEQIKPMTNNETYRVIRQFLLDNGEEMAEKITAAIPSEEEMKRRIDACIEKYAKDVPEEYKELHRRTLEEVYLEGKSFGEAIGFSDTDLDTLYSMAYNMYNMGRYKDARVIFCFLTVMNRAEARYFFGAAAAYHMLKDYDSAKEFYIYCTGLDYLNPVPYYHLADCYIQLDRPLDAAVSLNNVIDRTANNKVYNKIYDKAQLLLEDLLAKIMPEEQKT